MATTYQQFVDAVINNAATVLPTPVQNAEMVVESILDIALQNLAENYSQDERKRQLLKRTFSLSVVNGMVNLDPSILTSALDDTEVYDSTVDPPIPYSFMRNASGAVYGLDQRLGYYWIVGGDGVQVVPPTTSFSFAGGSTLTLQVIAAAIPVAPSSDVGTFDAPDEFMSDLIEETAKELIARVRA